MELRAPIADRLGASVGSAQTEREREKREMLSVHLDKEKEGVNVRQRNTDLRV